jgi:2',5'-phosphodiesterase
MIRRPAAFFLIVVTCLKIIAVSGISYGLRRSISTRAQVQRMSSSIKFTTYNVLSSHLSGENHFAACKPEWLDPSYRLKLVKEKLELEVKDEAIVCLQEVSHLWAGVLHSYFAARGYHLVTGLYGGKFNGYMGVAIAVPTSKYEIVDVDITRIADTKRIQRKPKPGFFQKLISSISQFLTQIAVKVGLAKPKFDFWDNVLYRTNQMICMRLKSKDSGKPFAVGTYHMPCMFKHPGGKLVH